MLWKWLYFTLIATTSVSTCARWTFLEQSGLQVRCNAIRSEYGWQCALARRRNLWICIWLILDPMSSWEGKGYDVYVFLYIYIAGIYRSLSLWIIIILLIQKHTFWDVLHGQSHIFHVFSEKHIHQTSPCLITKGCSWIPRRSRIAASSMCPFAKQRLGVLI